LHDHEVRITLGDCDASLVKIPLGLLLDVVLDLIVTIVSAIYPSIDRDNFEVNYFRERGITTPRNDTVNKINNFILDCLLGVKRLYLSADTVCRSFGDIDNADLLTLLSLSTNLILMVCHPMQYL
jgi:hypothetical protein